MKSGVAAQGGAGKPPSPGKAASQPHGSARNQISYRQVGGDNGDIAQMNLARLLGAIPIGYVQYHLHCAKKAKEEEGGQAAFLLDAGGRRT